MGEGAKQGGLTGSGCGTHQCDATFALVGFREQLNRIRIEESKQLLLNTDYSLADIALAMGFVDQSYFCKVFKRIVGLTPGKFRA